MRKTILVGRTADQRDVDIEVELQRKDDGIVRLSICGNVWQRNHRDIEMGGQCVDRLDAELRGGRYSFGWDSAKLNRIVEIWHRWHLNDMRAACEHQRANWPDVTQTRKLYTYTLTNEALSAQSKLKRRADEQLAATGSAQLTDDEKRVFSAPYSVVTYLDTLPSDLYKFKSSEEKAIGWLTQREHPDGLLSKPCEVCGYKYGNSWLHETLPAEILAEIKELTGVTPDGN